MKKKGSSLLCLLIAAIMILVGALGAMLMQTNFGKTKLYNVNIISKSGYKLAMDIYVPKTATSENPAPTIFVQHGGNNNKEEMQHYCVELARRGYVTVDVDMYGMGESEVLSDDTWLTMGRGLYDAVRYAVDLPYVDTDRIALLGYSRGGKAAGEALECDNAELNVVKAIFLIHSDPIVRNDEGYTDVYGARDIAVLADKNDEFFFSEKANDNGTYNNDANKYMANLSSPAEYVINNSAQAFLRFGEDPTGYDELLKAETVYEKEYEDGKVGTREINVSNESHMSGWWSPVVMKHVLTFFNRVLPTDTTVGVTNCSFYIIWNVFKAIALAGLIFFVVSLIRVLLEKVKAFKDADLGTPELRAVPDKKGYAWYWCIQIVGTILCILIIAFLNSKGLAAYRDALNRSANPTYHGLIAMLSGTVMMVLSFIWYLAYGKKHDFSLKGAGICVNKKQLWEGVATVLLGICAMFIIVFTVDYLFDVNFLFIYWGFMKVGTNRIPGMILVAPMYLLFYLVLSVSVNGFNFNNALTKNRYVSDILTAFIASLPTLFVLCYVYGIFRATGNNPMFGSLASSATAVFAFPGFVFVATLVMRYLYRKTGNIYIGGVLCGLLAAIAEWSVCEIRVHTPGTKYDGTALVYTLIVVGFVITIGCAIALAKKAGNKQIEK